MMKIFSECFKTAFEKDPIEKKKQKDKLEKETFPGLLKKLLAMKQQSSGAYLVGNEVSVTMEKGMKIELLCLAIYEIGRNIVRTEYYFIEFYFQLSWADIFLSAFLDQWLAVFHVDGISRFSLLTDLKDKVKECPAIKAYLAQRKETPF